MAGFEEPLVGAAVEYAPTVLEYLTLAARAATPYVEALGPYAVGIPVAATAGWEAGKRFGPVGHMARYKQAQYEDAVRWQAEQLAKLLALQAADREAFYRELRELGNYDAVYLPTPYHIPQPSLGFNIDATNTPLFAATQYLADMGAIPGSPGTRLVENGLPVAIGYNNVLDYLTANPSHIPGYRVPTPVRTLVDNQLSPELPLGPYTPNPEFPTFGPNIDMGALGVGESLNNPPVENNLGTGQPVENPDVVGDEDGTAGTEGGAVESNLGEAVAAEPVVVEEGELEDELEAALDAQGRPIEEEAESEGGPELEEGQEENENESQQLDQQQGNSENQPPKKNLLRKIFELEGNYTSGGGKAGKIARDAAKLGFIYGPAAVGLGEAVYNGIDYITRDKMDYIDEEGNDIPYETHWPASSWNPYGITWRIFLATKPDPEVEAEKRRRRKEAAKLKAEAKDNVAPNDTVTVENTEEDSTPKTTTTKTTTTNNLNSTEKNETTTPNNTPWDEDDLDKLLSNYK